jgi:hypothetical protein
MDCSKAMLALASIHERGLADETKSNLTIGAVQKK